MRFTRRVPAAVMAIVILLCAAARGQVLDQVPAESLVVMKVGNLQQTSTKLAKLCQDLGIAQMAPQMADPLGALQAKLKINNGIDKAGEVAFAYIDPAAVGGDSQHSMVMLWPVSDYKGFLSNFPDAKEEGGVATVKLGDDPDDSFVVNWGKYAAITPSKEVAALKPTGFKVQGAAAKELAKDFAVCANMPRLREMARPKLKDNRDKIITQMENALSQEAELAKYVPVFKAAVNRVLDLADQFLAESQSAVYSVNIGDSGVNVALVADFLDGSALGNGVKSFKNSNGSMLAGLPEGKYLFFGGGTGNPETAVKMISSLLDPISKEMTAVGAEQGTAFQKYVDAFKKYLGALKGQTFAMVAPTGALGQEPLLQVISIQAGDAATLKTAYVDMLKSQEDLMKVFGGAQAAGVTTETKPAAKTVDGVAFDVTTTQFNMQGGGPAAAQMQQMMSMFYGPNGATVTTGLVGDKALIGVGATDATLSATIAAVKGNQNPLGQLAGVKMVSAQLPQQRVAEFYAPLDQLATTLASYAGMMGMNMQLQLPPDLPPVGATLSTEGNAIRLEYYTPTELIKALVAAGMQTFMQMQHGAHPGGPGGL